ncbi:uncharacterized protein B0H18DRAFT_854224, partial [Fomitopsis serialis]|uniref:uncharacterized protein n=1 Tax=Fomitopsis serialis TaxID=139415 RepID=UPI002007E23E
SLASFVQHCAAFERKGAAHDFNCMILLVQLVYKCASISQPNTVNAAKIWRDHLSQLKGPPSKRTFQSWYTLGTRFAKIAEGGKNVHTQYTPHLTISVGSVYVLLLIAVKGLRVRLAEAEGSISEEIGNIMRRPDTKTEAGCAVRDALIPLVAILRAECPLRLSDLFDPSDVVSQGLSAHSLCGDLDSSDRFFKAIASNSFALVPRDDFAWASCIGITEIFADLADPTVPVREEPATHVSPEACGAFNLRGLSPLTPISTLSELDPWEPDSTPTSPTSTLDSFAVIKTSYDILHERNQRFSASRDRQANIVWTDQRRLLAARASVPVTRQALELEVSLSIEQGAVCEDRARYIRVSVSPIVLSLDILIIQDVHSIDMAGICNSMPNNMRDNPTDRLTACFPFNPLKTIHTAASGRDITFEALHFSWYNRHTTQGSTAPTDVPPFMLARPNGHRTNYTQMLPYTSKDMAQHEDIYQSLRNVLGDVFEWLDNKIATMFPNFYTRLENFAEILPGNNTPLSAPFLGLVVNLNVVTQAH